MTKTELRSYIKNGMNGGSVIMVCPICSKIDVWPDHAEDCDTEGESRRQENLDNYWK